MASAREAQQVAKRAVILGAIAFRASLEVTEHPRVVELSGRLLPWLREVGCDDELDPFERELLATPLGQLSDGQRIDANWAGEAGTFFCWALNLAAPLDVAAPADQSRLPGSLFILRPEANEILRSALLRESAELEDVCRHYALIRSVLREGRVALPAKEIIRRVSLEELDQVGLDVIEDAIRRASETVAGMQPEERSRATGLYFVRAHAALWLFGTGARYFESEP
ncbi:MAG TPA: DUF4272 domain-containing protein [Planctomycetaceae bacterium]|nr:DUF4272 domain-containing protein [Planctomycetaceae bacterium]